MSFWRRLSTPMLVHIVRRNQDISRRSFHGAIIQNINITSKVNNFCPRAFNSIRNKSKKAQYDSDDDEKIVDDSEDSSLSKDSKIVKFNTTSMRADAILKSALSVSRNKIEQHFYESKLRVNGKKILKKSLSAKLGDELDIIKMVSPNNPDHLYVARVEIVDIKPKEESIAVTVRRFKNLLIENYEQDPYKAGSSET